MHLSYPFPLLRLNPSYDCFAEWACASASPTLPASAIPTIPASSRVDITGEMQLADQLLRMADIHNEHIDANNAALMQLIELPKRPLGTSSFLIPFDESLIVFFSAGTFACGIAIE